MHPVAQDVVIGLLHFFSWPCVQVQKARKKIAQRHQPRYTRPRIESPLTLPPRIRALTLPLGSPDSTCSPAEYQQQSALFAQLPLEIRIMIYEEVLGGDVLYLGIRDRRLRHFPRVKGEGQGTWNNRTWATEWQQRKTWRPRCKPREGYNRRHLLSILITCHQAYSEAIDILYSRNTFYIANVKYLTYLPKMILSQRLNAIAALRLHWRLDGVPRAAMNDETTTEVVRYHSSAEWDQTWQILASMQGLRGLVVELYMVRRWESQWMNLDSDLFKPTKAVKAPDIFQLIMPFQGCPGALDITDLPFQIGYPREEPDMELVDRYYSMP